jgi:hypothetical protein
LEEECERPVFGVAEEIPFLDEFGLLREIACKVGKPAMGLMGQRRCFLQVG